MLQVNEAGVDGYSRSKLSALGSSPTLSRWRESFVGVVGSKSTPIRLGSERFVRLDPKVDLIPLQGGEVPVSLA